MIKSQLQEQADLCREAQEELDKATKIMHDARDALGYAEKNFCAAQTKVATCTDKMIKLCEGANPFNDPHTVASKADRGF